METTFSISEISKSTGLSYDTIRYYEKIKLLPFTKRKENGHRLYSKLDMERFIFIAHLKKTNMPLKEIQLYMNRATDKNYENCFAVLCEHKLKIQRQMEEMKATLEIINYKLDHFKDMMEQLSLEEGE